MSLYEAIDHAEPVIADIYSPGNDSEGSQRRKKETTLPRTRERQGRCGTERNESGSKKA
jgi:hypothetical protein